MYELCPGACDLLEMLINSWNPQGLLHEWLLPDGFHARIKVNVQKEAPVEVDELAHSTFTYTWYENETKNRDVKNAANVVHSIDGYVLRSLIRRCNYDKEVFTNAQGLMTQELIEREMSKALPDHEAHDEMSLYYQGHYDRSGLADIVLVPFITEANIKALHKSHLQKLNQIVSGMLEHESFEVITVHDDFKCLPNHMNWLRMHYRNILSEMADSNLLNDILSQLFDATVEYPPRDPGLSTTIKQANYALC